MFFRQSHTTSEKLGANQMFDFAFHQIESALSPPKGSESKQTIGITPLVLEQGYAAEFTIPGKEETIVLLSPMSDVEEKEHKAVDNTTPIDVMLSQLKTLMENNKKNRIFFIPLAESRKNRKHWTSLIIHRCNPVLLANFCDPKGELSSSWYDLQPLEQLLKNHGVRSLSKDYAGYQGIFDSTHCGYFVGAIFKEYVKYIKTTKNIMITRQPDLMNSMKTNLVLSAKECFENPSEAYKRCITDNEQIRRKRTLDSGVSDRSDEVIIDEDEPANDRDQFVHFIGNVSNRNEEAMTHHPFVADEKSDNKAIGVLIFGMLSFFAGCAITVILANPLPVIAGFLVMLKCLHSAHNMTLEPEDRLLYMRR